MARESGKATYVRIMSFRQSVLSALFSAAHRAGVAVTIDFPDNEHRGTVHVTYPEGVTDYNRVLGTPVNDWLIEVARSIEAWAHPEVLPGLEPYMTRRKA